MQALDFINTAHKHLTVSGLIKSSGELVKWTKLDSICPTSPGLDCYIKQRFDRSFSTFGSSSPLFDCIALFGVLQRDPPWGDLRQKRLAVVVGGGHQEFEFITGDACSLESHHLPLTVDQAPGVNKEFLHQSSLIGILEDTSPEAINVPRTQIASLVLRQVGCVETLRDICQQFEGGLCSVTNLFVLDRAEVILEFQSFLTRKNNTAIIHIIETAQIGLNILFTEEAFRYDRTVDPCHLTHPATSTIKTWSDSEESVVKVRLFETVPPLGITEFLKFSIPDSDSFLRIRPRRPSLVMSECITVTTEKPYNLQETLRPNESTLSELGLLFLNDGKVDGSGLIVDASGGLSSISVQTPIHPNERTVWGRSHVLDQYKQIHTGFLDKRYLYPTKIEGSFYLPYRFGKPRRISGLVIFAGALYSHVYSHWLIDILSRFWCLPYLGELGISVNTIVVSGPLTEKQYATLRLLGFNENQIVPIKSGEWIEAEKLIAPTRATRMYDFIAPEVVALFDRVLRSALRSSDLQENYPFRRVYASRDSRAIRRPFLNENKAYELFKSKGFEGVDFSKLSLIEELKLLKETSVLAGPHGSALAGSLFMGEGTQLFCLLPQDLGRVISHNYSMTSARQMSLVNIIGENFSGRPDIAPWVINLEQLEYSLDKYIS